MSLPIDPSRVTRVLLADGWHDVARRSFVLTADRSARYTTAAPGEGMPASAYVFTDTEGQMLSGPVAAIDGVTYDEAPR